MAKFVDFETDELSIAKLLEQWNHEIKAVSVWDAKLPKFPTGQRILAASPQAQLGLVRYLLKKPSATLYAYNAIGTVLEQLLRRQLPFTHADLENILECLIRRGNPNQGWLRTIANAIKTPEQLEASRAKLEELKSVVQQWYECADKRKFLRLLEDILNPGQKATEGVRLALDEWGAQAQTHLESLSPDLLERWQAVLNYGAISKGSKPTSKWLEAAKPVLERLGEADFVPLLCDWLEFFSRSSFKPPTHADGGYQMGCLLDEENADLLRALIWLSGGVSSAGLASALASAALSGFRKVSGHGPRSAKVGTACIWALEAMPGLHAAGQLERVRLGVKQPQYQKVLEASLNRVAARENLSREDLEELTVPDFDLTQGRRSLSLGEVRAELSVQGSSVQVDWFGADGKPRKTVPAAVKSEFKDELKTLKKGVDDLEKMLAAQSQRLERLPLLRRSWPLALWKERYLEHPLLGTLVERLLWHVRDADTEQDAFWLEGGPVDALGQPLSFSETAVVTPWHPVFCDAPEVLAWREFLERREITQPFKQAHREVYLLTEAELRTTTYSNRFAAHILKQHQFHALCAVRSWTNPLRLMVDDSYAPPTLELPHWNLRAEFWVEGAGNQYGSDTNEAGTYLYLATDQVRFFALDAPHNSAHAGGGGYSPDGIWRRIAAPQFHSLPLEQIPALVFSEVMRDIDLFVGVCSVGGDPTWLDGGPQAHRAYWQDYSFGELSSSAQSRKELLERLLPRLKIRDRLTLEGRFLRVRGDLRTYKIHLGSGNILMEPNDQYLCIVPSGDRASPTHSGLKLPFEGDRTLSVILSKALLLADDTTITDPTILRQLSRSRSLERPTWTG